MGTGVSVLSVLQKGLQGWIRTASTRRTVRRVKKPLRGFFRCAARAIHPRPPRTPVSNGYRSFCFICLAKGDARVDSNSIDPGSFSARLAQSTRAHQKTATYPNTLRFCFAMLFPAISASPSHQSSCARILFCTISPAGVRARMRPSKVAYPARTQFCTKVSCAVENCLPYRVL